MGWVLEEVSLLRAGLTSGTTLHYRESSKSANPKLHHKLLSLLVFVNIYLFIWLHWVLVTACQLLAATCGI